MNQLKSLSPKYVHKLAENCEFGGIKKNLFVTKFWKITYMVAPETIRIFEFSMALLIAETTFKNISKLYLQF